MLLLVRSIVFSLLLPAVIVGWVPLRLFERHAFWTNVPLTLTEWLALFLALLGSAGYLHCAWLFARKGGTVAPFDPPRKLVQRGLYRWVRNPIYLSLGVLVAAEALYFESWHIAVYLLCLACLAQLIVVLHEESDLGFRFGAMYEDYKRTAPRWIPRRPQSQALEDPVTSRER